ncbi:hypothetical protein P9853_38 [Streptococcus phage P9853]|uniref:Uncharacterized protein n=1 Tax=Streptococcus phage P9853 TaxID=1971445 RepID=A0A286QSE4_9CAUD|nr:hypothetical protein PQF06_gp38 [Streptococcus phage P9853]ARU14638.1 hypothetical protein P9853_38 [Streptococcus phage P9853]
MPRCPKVSKTLIYQGFSWALLRVSWMVTGDKLGDI